MSASRIGLILKTRLNSSIYNCCISRSFALAASTKSKTTLYELLGVKTDATNVELKEGFLNRCKELHPDKNPESPEESSEEFKKVAAAYEILTNSKSRHEYDSEIGVGKFSKDNLLKDRRNKSQIYRHPLRKDDFPIRNIEVDLSPERMAKAWEAYKNRWAREEDKLKELEEKKRIFRQDMEKARSIMNTMMTPKERAEFRNSIKNMSIPSNLKKFTEQADNKAYYDNIESKYSEDNFRPPPEHNNNNQNRSFQGIFKDGQKAFNDIFVEVVENTKKTTNTVKDNYDRSSFLIHNTQSMHNSLGGNIPQRNNIVSINKNFATFVFSLSLIIIMISLLYPEDEDIYDYNKLIENRQQMQAELNKSN